MTEYVKCSVCGRKYQGIVPEGGDGSELQPRLHYAKVQSNLKKFTVCNRANNKEYCDGSFLEAEYWEEASK